MDNVIRVIGAVSPCDTCGEKEGVKEFEFGGEVRMAWCPRCAREVIGVLRSKFPEELPQFVKTMQRL